MYFQKVAELEHLTKAAEALHIAQPALSRTIRSMEEELDVSLFTHQGRNIHLTRDGHILLKYTNKILGSLDDLRQELQDSRDLQQLTVKLAIMSSICFRLENKVRSVFEALAESLFCGTISKMVSGYSSLNFIRKAGINLLDDKIASFTVSC